MSNKKIEFYLVGDFNIDLLQSHCNQIIKTYADNLLGYSVKCCINKPTRISVSTKSLLDHIYTIDFNRSLFSGIALCDISDDLPAFIFIKDIKYIKKKLKEVYIRDMKDFLEELFCQDLYKQLGDLHVTESLSPHDQFEEFVKLFTDIVNFYAPRRRATRKEKKLKSKPWFTQGLLKSIKLKNKIYKQFLMHPSNYQFDKYKKYRNVLNRAIEGAKQNYYNKIVTKEKHNSEKLYQIINKIWKLKNSKRIFPTNLLNDKGNVTKKPEEIACVLNEHFASVGYKMAQDIPPPPSHIKMTKPNSCNFKSIFLFPSTNAKVCSIIDRLKTKKAQRYTDLETKFIKYGKLIISPIISNLFKLCIETGVFPNCLKIAEVIPIYKKGDQNIPTNYSSGSQTFLAIGTL